MNHSHAIHPRTVVRPPAATSTQPAVGPKRFYGDGSIHSERRRVMTFTKFLIGGAGLAALATAAPSPSQYYPRSYGYGYGVNTNVAAQQCTSAVQNRLYNR